MIIGFVIVGLLILGAALFRYTAFFSFYGNKGEVRVLTDIVYREGSNNPKHTLDLYLPKDAKNFPVVHFIHGGYWHSGDKNYYQEVTGLYGSIGIALAQRGVGAVIQNYRLVPDVAFEDQIDDVAAAVAWTVNNISKYDGGKNIYVMGHSAGGHMTALLASDARYLRDKSVRADAIKGFIPMSAIMDLSDMVAKNDDTFNEQISYLVFGRSEANFKKYSPVTHFRSGTAPMLILSGERDFSYIAAQDVAAADQLKKLNRSTQSFIAPNYNHMDMVVRFGRTNDVLIKKVLEFIKK